MSPRSKPSDSRPPGFIQSDAVYTLAEACVRLGWRKQLLATAKRAGLPVIRLGTRAYVRGCDVAALYDRLAQAQGGEQDEQGSHLAAARERA